MGRGLRSKFVFIMLVLIVLLMTVVLAFLIRGVRDFFLDDFSARMQTTFNDADMVANLRRAADFSDAPYQLSEIVSAYAGPLGVDSISRKYYILDGATGQHIPEDESEQPETIAVTTVILAAISGDELYTGSSGAVMDAAVAVSGESGRYIVYIRDEMRAQELLASEIFKMILEAVAVGFIISVVISLLLAHTLLGPIRGMTRAAEAMADGDFSRRIAVESEDEIGVLSNTFNTMAQQLRDNLDELQTAEQKRREFVANVSHELRTPLTSIRSFAEIVQDMPDLDDETRLRSLSIIINESDRMTQIVDDLLYLSQFDAERVQLTLARFPLLKSVGDVYTAISIQAEQHNHTLSLDLPYGLPEVFGDRARIEQVLMNIMTNAVKYTPDGGEINVTGGFDAKNAWVTISDTGLGIPEEDLPKIFDRFHVVDKARSRASGGTGLGLSIADEIMKRHGGDIRVRSKLGVGSSFTVTMPVDGSKT